MMENLDKLEQRFEYLLRSTVRPERTRWW